MEYSKTNVIISTVGMTGKSHNHKGTVELAISCETFDVVFQDEKQKENGENLSVIPCCLKLSSGLLVLFDDGEQAPPYLPGVLRFAKSMRVRKVQYSSNSLKEQGMFSKAPVLVLCSTLCH